MPQPPDLAPIRTPDNRFEGDSAWAEEHPAYGMLTISVTNGAPGPLFGSKLPKHDRYITFRLCHAKRHFSSAEEHNYSGKVISEFAVTFSQLHSMLAYMNQGEGMPVTLQYVPDAPPVRVPRILWPEGHDGTEGSAAVETLRERTAAFEAKITKLDEDISAILEETKLPKKTKEAILGVVRKHKQDVQSNLPFYVGQVLEAGERVVDAARREVDGVVQHIAAKLGFASLRQLAEQADKEDPPKLTE